MKVLATTVKYTSVKQNKCLNVFFATTLGRVRVTWMYEKNKDGTYNQKGRIIRKELLTLNFAEKLEKAAKLHYNQMIKAKHEEVLIERPNFTKEEKEILKAFADKGDK